MSAATAGAVLASRRPRHPVGWLLLAFGLVAQALSSAAEGYARYGLLARPSRRAPPCSSRGPTPVVTLAPKLSLPVNYAMQPTQASLWLRPPIDGSKPHTIQWDY